MSDRAVCRHVRDEVYACERVSVCVVVVRRMSNKVCAFVVYFLPSAVVICSTSGG